MDTFKFKMGSKAQDIITGFTGIIVNQSEWLTAILEHVANLQNEDDANIINIYDETSTLKDKGGPQDIPQKTNRF